MWEIDNAYYRPTVKKIDNITSKIGIDPKNIGVFENFISQEEIARLRKEYESIEPEYNIDHTHGITMPIHKGTEYMMDFARKMAPIVKKNAEDFYGMEMEMDRDAQWTYHPSGSYLDPHTDVLGFVPKYDGRNDYPAQEEDFPYYWSGHLSNLIYINDDFEGGELFFPDFKLQIKPKPGMLILFPGNTHYLHGVKETKGSTRYTYSLWMKFKDFENFL